MNPKNLPLVLTRQEVATLLRVTPRTLDNMISRGELRVTKVSRSVRIPRAEAMRLLGLEGSAA